MPSGPPSSSRITGVFAVSDSAKAAWLGRLRLKAIARLRLKAIAPDKAVVTAVKVKLFMFLARGKQLRGLSSFGTETYAKAKGAGNHRQNLSNFDDGGGNIMG